MQNAAGSLACVLLGYLFDISTDSWNSFFGTMSFISIPAFFHDPEVSVFNICFGERDTHIHTNTHTDRQTDTHTERERERERERES